MTNIVGSLQVSLGLDSAEFVNGLSKADAVAASFAAKQERNSKAIDKIVVALEKQVSYLGKTEREIKLLQLTQRGANETQLASVNAAYKAIEAERERVAQLSKAKVQEEAKKAAQEKSTRSIESSISSIQLQTAVMGKSADEAKLIELAFRGATKAQLELADAALKQQAIASKQHNDASAAAAETAAKEKSVRAIDDSIRSLERQRDAVGKTAQEIKILQYAEEGATEAQLRSITAILAATQAAEKQANEKSKAVASQDRLAASIKAEVESLQLEALYLGKSAEQIKLMEFARQGANKAQLDSVAASQAAATSTRVDYEAKQKLIAADQAAEKAQVQSARSIETAIAAYEREAAAIGKTERQLKLLTLEEQGATPAQLERANAILKSTEAAKLQAEAQREAAIATERASREAKRGVSNYYQFAAGQKLTALQAQQLSFQLNDFFVQVASGQSPLLALIQQGSQLNGQFGGVGGTFRALASVFTATRVAMAGILGIVAAIGYGFAKGAEESAKLATSLTLTGNAAAVTEHQFNAAAASIASSTGATIGSSRETLQALVSSGRFVGQTLTEAGRAIEGLSKVSGQETSAIISNFVSLADNVTTGAESLNKTYHFLTADQLAYIKTLEDQGEAQKALGVVLDAFNNRLAETIPQLSGLETAYGRIKQVISSVVDAVKDLGRVSTPEQQAGDIRNMINGIEFQAKRRGGQMSPRDAQYLTDLKEELAGITEITRLTERQSKATAKNIQLNDAQLAFRKEEEKYLNNAEIRAKEIARANKLADTGEISAKRRDQLIANINEKKKDPKPSGVGEANRTQQELREAEIKSAKDFANQQKIVNDYSQKYLDTQYSVGLLSLEDYYTKQDALRKQALAQETANYQKQIDIDNKFANQSKGSIKLDFQGKAKDTEFLKNQAILKSVEDQKVMELQRSEAVKQANNQYKELIATVKELSGDLEGAARIRNALSAESARKTVSQIGGDPDVVTRLERQQELMLQLQTVSKTYSEFSAKQAYAEQSIAIQAEISGKSQIQILQQLGVSRRDSIVQLAEMEAKARELAQTLGTPEAIQFAQQLSLALQQANRDIDPVLNNLKSLGKEVGDSIAGGFSDAISEGKNLKDTINDIGKSIFRLVQNEVFTKPLGNFLSNTINGGATSALGSGGFLGNVLGSLFGFGGGSASSSIGNMGANFLIPGAAGGGYSPPHSLRQVNELGPELLDVNGKQFLMMGNKGGQITPNSQLGGGGRSDLYITLNPPAGMDRRTSNQFLSDAGRQIQNAVTRDS